MRAEGTVIRKAPPSLIKVKKKYNNERRNKNHKLWKVESWKPSKEDRSIAILLIIQPTIAVDSSCHSSDRSSNSLRAMKELKRIAIHPITMTRRNIEVVSETSRTRLRLTAQRIRLQTRRRGRRSERRENSRPSFLRDTDCCRIFSTLRFARRGERVLESPSSVVLYRASSRFRSRNSTSFGIYVRRGNLIFFSCTFFFYVCIQNSRNLINLDK